MNKLPDWTDLVDWNELKKDELLSKIQQLYHKNYLFNYFVRDAKNTDYKKFMIISTQRSGTSLLLNILRSHSNVLAFSEVFYEEVKPFLYYKKITQNLYRYGQRNPSKYLMKYYFRPYPDQVKAVGFKYMYNQLSVNNFKKVLKIFDSHKDLIIHLKRQNKLRALVSHKLLIANSINSVLKKTLVQKTLNEHVIQNIVNINCLELIEYVKRVVQQEQKYESLIKNYRHITLYYEDLEKKPVEEANKIIEALDLQKDQLYVVNEKLNTRPLSEVIINYHQLKNVFKYSSYSKYFDE